MNWYLAVIKKYAEFSGRARRKEYWMFFLFNILISFVIGILGAIIGNRRTHYGLAFRFVLAVYFHPQHRSHGSSPA